MWRAGTCGRTCSGEEIRSWRSSRPLSAFCRLRCSNSAINLSTGRSADWNASCGRVADSMIFSFRRLRSAVAPWVRGYRLSREYWLFFTAALFWDAGFGLYLFLFNLYLIDFHLNERAIGLI